jgi:hypothetical protein
MKHNNTKSKQKGNGKRQGSRVSRKQQQKKKCNGWLTVTKINRENIQLITVCMLDEQKKKNERCRKIGSRSALYQPKQCL